MNTTTRNFRITLSGECGAGKGSAGKESARVLSLPFVSTGDLFRLEAQRRGLSLAELHKLARQEPEIDRQIDAQTREYGERHQAFVFDARLAWHFIPHSFKVFLVCEENERMRRIADREGKPIEVVRRETLYREALMREQYAHLYGIDDFMRPDQCRFDLIIDTTRLSIRDVTARIICGATRYSLG